MILLGMYDQLVHVHRDGRDTCRQWLEAIEPEIMDLETSTASEAPG
jgi:hypothetical protein